MPQCERLEEPDSLEEGSRVLCIECRGEMQLVAELDGATSCWLLEAALLLVAWVSQHPAGDLRSMLASVARRLQVEAESSGDRARWATLTPGDIFFIADHFLAFETMLEQRAASQGSSDACRSKDRAGSVRGPPSAGAPSHSRDTASSRNSDTAPSDNREQVHRPRPLQVKSA